VLALDLTTNTGWAVDRPDGGEKPLIGTHRLPSGGKEYGYALLALADWVLSMIEVHKPDVVAFEAPLMFGRGGPTRPTNVDTVRRMLGSASIAEYVATDLDLTVFETDVQTWRRHFVANGRANKSDVIHRCRLLSWGVLDDNQGDACGIWDYARHCLRAQRLTAGPLYAGAR